MVANIVKRSREANTYILTTPRFDPDSVTETWQGPATATSFVSSIELDGPWRAEVASKGLLRPDVAVLPMASCLMQPSLYRGSGSF